MEVDKVFTAVCYLDMFSYVGCNFIINLVGQSLFSKLSIALLLGDWRYSRY